MADLSALIQRLSDLHQKIADEPSLKRGMVWCRTCGRSRKIDSAHCLAHGWPKCCGYTMTIDDPAASLRARERE